MESDVLVYAVIITFNPELDLLNKEYNSIKNQVAGIFYVDNNSLNKNAIKEWSNGKHNIHFDWLESNEGIGYAQNVGIKHALEHKASHVIIFDQDSIVASNFVENLVLSEKQAIDSGLNVGITGPIYFSEDDGYAYPILDVSKGKVARIPQESFNTFLKTTHVIASGELIKAEVFRKIGLMREDLFIGYIDFEFCFRASKYSYDTIVTKSAVMKHKMGDNQIVLFGRKIGIYSPFRRYFDCRNTLLIQKDTIFPKCLRKYYLKLMFGKILISLIFGPKRLLQLKYCLRGLSDGLKGVGGHCSIK